MVVLDRMLLVCINICIYAMLRTRATFSWSTLYKGACYLLPFWNYFLLEGLNCVLDWRSGFSAWCDSDGWSEAFHNVAALVWLGHAQINYIRILSAGFSSITIELRREQSSAARHTVIVFSLALAKLRKANLASSCLSVRPSARMEQLGSHWTDFHVIWYF